MLTLGSLASRSQCDQIRRNFATLAKKINVFGEILELFILYLANFCTHFGIFYATGQIVIVANGHTLNNNIAVWSHWSELQIQ